MQLTRFGRIGMSVSRLCLGTAAFGGQTDEAESHRILDAAADAGVQLSRYRQFLSHGRRASAARRHGERQVPPLYRRVQAGAPMSPLPWDQGGSRKHLLDAIVASLRRLGTDYVDLYQLHWDDPPTPLDKTLEAFNVS